MIQQPLGFHTQQDIAKWVCHVFILFFLSGISKTRGQFSPILFLKKNLVFLTGVRLQVLRDKRFLFAIKNIYNTNSRMWLFFFFPCFLYYPETTDLTSESNFRCRRVIQSPGYSITDSLAHVLCRSGSTTPPLVIIFLM